MHNHPSFKPAQRNKEDFYSGPVFKTKFLLYENQIQRLDYEKRKLLGTVFFFLAIQQIFANSCAAKKH